MMANRTTMYVGFRPASVFMKHCLFHLTKPCRTIGSGGINYDVIVTLLQTILGYTNIQLRKSAGSKPDNISLPPNEWNGLAGMLIRNEIDISGTPLFIDTPADLLNVDISLPLATDVVGLIFSSNQGAEWKTWDKFIIFRPFKWVVWLLIIASSILLKLMSRLVHWTSVFKAFLVFVFIRHYKTIFFALEIQQNVVQPDRINSFEEFVELFEKNEIHLVVGSYQTSSLVSYFWNILSYAKHLL